MDSSTTNDAGIIALLASRGWVSLNQFAKLAGVAYPTAKRLVDRGSIKVTRVGGILRIYAEEVQRFLREGNAKDNEPELS